MKIGILTFWKTEDNYGQLLQCFATCQFLRSMGHTPFLVRTTNGHEYNPSLKEQLKDKMRTAFRLKSYPLYLLKRASGSFIYLLTHGRLRKRIPQRQFENFRQEYLNCTENIYTLRMLEENPPQADVFMVGSDQIWNTTDGLYFLCWAPDNVKKISNAASFGARGITEEFCNLISPWLKRFDLITVREISGIDICSAAGYKDAECVQDPTLMLQSSDYESIMEKYPVKGSYLFIYFLGTRTDINWKEIHRFAKDKGLDIVYVGSQGQEDKYKKHEPTIGQWLWLIRNASYVVTNSFHGTVFAMQFRKKFMVYPIVGPASKMNDRLTTLLSPVNLTNRIYNGSIYFIDKEIDYNTIHNYWSGKRNKHQTLIGSVLNQ